MLDQSRREHRARLADIRYEHLLFAEDFRFGSKAVVLQERLDRRREAAGARQLAHARHADARATPRPRRSRWNASIAIRPTGRRTSSRRERCGRRAGTLAPGSYRLVLRAPGWPSRVPVRGRARREGRPSTSPAAERRGPGGIRRTCRRASSGSATRTSRCEPSSSTRFRSTGGTPTATASRATKRPTASGLRSSTHCRRPSARDTCAQRPPAAAADRCVCTETARARGSWRSQPASHRYSAKVGEALSYIGRHERARQDWSRLPVVGIAPADAMRYLEWLRATRRVPGARLCTEVEWERAARGADDRLFPHGDELRLTKRTSTRPMGASTPHTGPTPSGRIRRRAARSASMTWLEMCSSSSRLRRRPTKS